MIRRKKSKKEKKANWILARIFSLGPIVPERQDLRDVVRRKREKERERESKREREKAKEKERM